MTTDLVIPLPSGIQLAAVFERPQGEGRWPLVILLHGFTGHKQGPHLVSLAAALAGAGVASIRFDAPGSGGSTGAWADDYRATGYLQSVSDVYDYAVASLPVDSGRVGLWGHSMGAAVAVMAAAKLPVRAVVSCQPPDTPLNSPVFTKELMASWKATGWHEFSSPVFPSIRLPYACALDTMQIDAAKAAPEVHCPSLFLAGTHDTTVPPELVRRVYKAALEPKSYIEFPAGHDYGQYPELRAMFDNAALVFFRRYLTPLTPAGHNVNVKLGTR